MSNMVVTNLRMERHEWLQIKAMAGEAGLSVNEYIKTMLRKIEARKNLGLDTHEKAMIRFIRGIERISKMKNKPMGASEEDKIIYGIKD
ncbi:MAG: hypothetical protein Q7R95_05790 [bacterium]|nr:hypothetical protein [bacterium]